MRRTKTRAARQSTPAKIIVYGHNKSEFPDSDALIDYITTGIIKNRCRYRYTQRKHANIIILSLGGVAFEQFEISDETTPDDQDRDEYPPVKKVYIVGKRASYFIPVELMPLEIRVHRFGTPISATQLNQIRMKAGHIQEFS